MNPQSRNGARRLGDPTPDSGTQQTLPRLWGSTLPRECLPVAGERAGFPFLPTAFAGLQKRRGSLDMLSKLALQIGGAVFLVAQHEHRNLQPGTRSHAVNRRQLSRPGKNPPHPPVGDADGHGCQDRHRGKRPAVEPESPALQHGLPPPCGIKSRKSLEHGMRNRSTSGFADDFLGGLVHVYCELSTARGVNSTKSPIQA